MSNPNRRCCNCDSSKLFKVDRIISTRSTTIHSNHESVVYCTRSGAASPKEVVMDTPRRQIHHGDSNTPSPIMTTNESPPPTGGSDFVSSMPILVRSMIVFAREPVMASRIILLALRYHLTSRPICSANEHILTLSHSITWQSLLSTFDTTNRGKIREICRAWLSDDFCDELVELICPQAVQKIHCVLKQLRCMLHEENAKIQEVFAQAEANVANHQQDILQPNSLDDVSREMARTARALRKSSDASMASLLHKSRKLASLVSRRDSIIVDPVSRHPFNKRAQQPSTLNARFKSLSLPFRIDDDTWHATPRHQSPSIPEICSRQQCQQRSVAGLIAMNWSELLQMPASSLREELARVDVLRPQSHCEIVYYTRDYYNRTRSDRCVSCRGKINTSSDYEMPNTRFPSNVASDESSPSDPDLSPEI